MVTTCALVLDTTINTFSLMTGTMEEIIKEHKKWVLKLKKQEWITIPEVLPVVLNRQAILAIRVVEIPSQAEGAYRTLSNPRMRAYASNFLNKSEQLAGKIEEQPGIDILDQGFKQ